MSIIIIDDNVEICTLIEEVLTSEGFKCRSCTNPIIVFEMIKQQKPRLIVTDMLMSGIDGREIVKQLKGDDSTSDIKVLLISAYPHAGPISSDVGADAHLSKPFEISDLTDRVRALMS